MDQQLNPETKTVSNDCSMVNCPFVNPSGCKLNDKICPYYSNINEKMVKDMSLYLADHPIKELMELVMKSIEISGKHN